MRTEELAAMLARGAAVERLPRSAHLWVIASAGGLVAATAVLLIAFGLHPQLLSLMALGGWWAKALFSLGVAATALHAALVLGRPGADPRRPLRLLLVPFAVMAALGAGQLALAPVGQWGDLIVGKTWLECMVIVAGLSVPTMVLSMRALAAVAPTRPMLAGAVAGLGAGGIGASVYALHCPEIAPAFVIVWYGFGMLAPAVVGAWVGWHWLRW